MRTVVKHKVRAPHVVFNNETIKNASRFLGVFECDVVKGDVTNCIVSSVSYGEDAEVIDALHYFFQNKIKFNTVGDMDIHDMVFFILEGISMIPDALRSFDGTYDTREVFKMLQEDVKNRFFGEEVLYPWGAANEFWINRSLSVMDDTRVVDKFLGNDGKPTMNKIFRHAQNQCTYWLITGVIDMINFD